MGDVIDSTLMHINDLPILYLYLYLYTKRRLIFAEV